MKIKFDVKFDYESESVIKTVPFSINYKNLREEGLVVHTFSRIGGMPVEDIEIIWNDSSLPKTNDPDRTVSEMEEYILAEYRNSERR